MSHDPMCPGAASDRWQSVDACGPCDWIRRIREDERNRIDRATPWTGGDR